eukprot:CAMPEP_0117673180 /NCGR_PEP_ID=MMETSP0804-20121206/14331_1 /TAXON_ID=1074897 /ORGANISM="Tetraselmis astigmatica, Strain CCMP880" /LENGTH=149 /DNA_ID=CAMNT_0005481893 /DNA_START=496 /DNA_END=942 /DNA_ORIENTATION=+
MGRLVELGSQRRAVSTAALLLLVLAACSLPIEGARELGLGRSLKQACMCTAEYDPVCLEDGTEVASNRCNARCNPKIPVVQGMVYKKEWCSFGRNHPVEPVNVQIPPKKETPAKNRPSPGAPASHDAEAQPNGCLCPAVYQPVCLEDGT